MHLSRLFIIFSSLATLTTAKPVSISDTTSSIDTAQPTNRTIKPRDGSPRPVKSKPAEPDNNDLSPSSRYIPQDTSWFDNTSPSNAKDLDDINSAIFRDQTANTSLSKTRSDFNKATHNTFPHDRLDTYIWQNMTQTLNLTSLRSTYARRNNTSLLSAIDSAIFRDISAKWPLTRLRNEQITKYDAFKDPSLENVIDAAVFRYLVEKQNKNLAHQREEYIRRAWRGTTYIDQPNSARCLWESRFGQTSVYWLNLTGPFTGHDWGRELRYAIEESCKNFDRPMIRWRFEYYGGSGTYEYKFTRNYTEPGSGPGWATFDLPIPNQDHLENIGCVERAIRKTSERTGELVDVDCDWVQSIPKMKSVDKSHCMSHQCSGYPGHDRASNFGDTGQ